MPAEGINDPTSTKVKEAFKVFLEAHPSQGIRETLQWAYDKITYIPFSLFMRTLHRVVVKIDRRLDGKPYVLAVSRLKSSQWVAELALAYFKNQPRYVVEVKEFYEFTKDHPEIRCVVFLDDVACSGRYISKVIQNRLFALRDLNNKPFTVLIGIPFITRFAMDIIKKIPLGQGGTIEVHREIEVPSVKKKVGDPVYRSNLHYMYHSTHIANKIKLCLMLGSGVEKEYSTSMNVSFVNTLGQLGFSKCDLLRRFMIMVNRLHLETENLTLNDVTIIPLMRWSADLIFEELEKFLPKLRLRMDLESNVVICEIEKKLVQIFNEFDDTLTDAGLSSRTLVVFDHGVPDAQSTLEPLSTGAVYDANGSVKYFPFFDCDPGYRYQNISLRKTQCVEE